MERTASGQRTRLAMRRLHHSGPDPFRVLLIGDRSVLGDPARSPEPTLAQRIADRLWLTTQRGVDLDVLTDLTPVLRAVHGAFDEWRLWRYDAVVVALGSPVDGVARIRLRRRLGDLVHEVLADAALSTFLLLVAPVKAARSRHAASGVVRFGGTVVGDGDERVATCVVDAAEESRSWATAVAGRLAEPLQRAGQRSRLPGGAAARRNRPDDEAERQRALDALGVVGLDPDPRLEDIVELARTALGTESAEINFIDRDRQWKMAVAGSDRQESPREESFCNLTIQRAEPTVVEDARRDPLLRLSPAVTGPRQVRFYAAYPLESVDGYRIGTLCVYDSEPRRASGVNLNLLRDLALLAQAELTGADEAPAGVGVGPAGS